MDVITDLNKVFAIPMHPNEIQVFPWHQPFQDQKEETVND
jgi:hypothetical protein